MLAHVSTRYGVSVVPRSGEMVDVRMSICPNDSITRAMHPRLCFGRVLSFSSGLC